MVSQAIVLSLLAKLRDYVEYAKVDTSEVYRNLRDGLADFDRIADFVRLYLERTA